MKRFALAFIVLTAVAAAVFAKTDKSSAFEYATIRWDGLENSHIVLPGAAVRFVGKDLRSFKKPDRVDERVFYLNIMMNSLGAEGFEFAGFSGDQNQIVMKRHPN